MSNDLSKVNIAVLFGGNSTEHDISIITAVQAMENIDKNKYNIIPIYISKNNEFYYSEKLRDIENYKNISLLINKLCQNVYLVKRGEFVYMCYKKKFSHKKVNIDLAFPIVHGTNVEDGNLQGYLHTIGLPFVGCGVESSAICMNKYLTKTILKNINIPVVEGQKINNIKDLEKVSFPVVVKPNNLGSSIGISKIENNNELKKAVQNAFLYSSEVVVEKAIVPLREINCAVLGDCDGEVITSKLEEPLTNKELLSFNEKYLSGGKSKKSGSVKSGNGNMDNISRKCPADVPKDIENKIRHFAEHAFKELGCSGVVRIDFLLDKKSNIYLNEVNTIPGSLSYYLWGFPYKQLIDKLIDLAFGRTRNEKKFTYSFETSVLEKVKV